MINAINPVYLDILKKRLDQFAKEKKKEIEENGIAVINNLFTAEFLNEMKSKAMEYFRENPKKSSYSGNELKGSCFHSFAISDFVINFCNSLLKDQGVSFGIEDIRPVLGIGTPPEYKNKLLHFDSVYLTMAVPVVMPDTSRKDCGAFRIWPNVRKFSTSKVQNLFFWRLMRTPWLRDRFKHFDLNFEPGNAYLFYGFRSWHGIGDLGEDLLRINSLIHVGEVQSVIRKV